jgi:hypothetical protein
MTYYITNIQGVIGNNYLGIDLPITIIQPYLNQLKDILGEKDYNKFTEQQIRRDNGHYHITIINTIDYNRLSKEIGMDKFINSLDLIFKYPIDDIKMMGIGTAQRNDNISYFIVCESDKLDAVRTRYSLPKHDFHVTLGFFSKDVFGVRKDKVLTIKSNFLKLLKQEFYNKENFNFIKKISNFDLNQDSEIIPISLSDNYLKVLCDDNILNIGIIEKNNIKELYILNKYNFEEEKIIRMPLTDIYKKLENI